MIPNRIKKAAIAAAVIVASFASAYPAVEKRLLESAAAGNNDFGFSLFHALASPGKNLFISPLSIGVSFSMACAGARGATEREITRVLRFRIGGEDLQRAYSDLLYDLEVRAKEGKCRFDSANRLWFDRSVAGEKKFSETLKKYYNAAPEQVKFSADPEGARRAINSWVAGRTGDKIRDLVPEGSVTKTTRLLLINALYFLGSWKNPFDEKRTEQSEFFISAKKTVPAGFMRMTTYFPYRELNDLQVLSIPYKAGDLSLIVILPKRVDGLAAVEKKLTPENFKKWTAGLEKREVILSLPRFDITSSSGLSDTLKRMGMNTAFSPRADFSGMAPNLAIGEALHKAFVSVNEKGTEAAAASSISMVKANGGRKHVFRADHPFVFMIYDSRSGAVVFIGRLADPSVRQ